jgi:hypothetical protein
MTAIADQQLFEELNCPTPILRPATLQPDVAEFPDLRDSTVSWVASVSR